VDPCDSEKHFVEVLEQAMLDSPRCTIEMSGLSYFGIQIQSWIFKVQSSPATVQTFFEITSPSL